MNEQTTKIVYLKINILFVLKFLQQQPEKNFCYLGFSLREIQENFFEIFAHNVVSSQVYMLP